MALDEIKRYVQTQLQATKSRKQFISNHLLASETIINTLGHRYEKQKKVEIDILKNNNKSANFTYIEESLAMENNIQIPPEPDKVNLKIPTCASYVYGGAYIPLIVQIASMVLNSIPLDDIKMKLETLGTVAVRNDNGYPLLCRTILVYVVGGMTYAEIAACNLLETLTGAKICVLSDIVLNGNDLMKDILSI
ncbi:hypothetical protein GWI33_008411 [Rhynchophorus ferrugineus]|uniref:Uncharacterized protein n=1 Tax=Rhynchophorus ferrugineus TaxID=354439 RepID=A0A834ICN3_RHYFE|nr:hypothetical protein GWI33_008411 [Rhynchophorus ferrugineus]